MEPTEFRNWRKSLGWKQKDAAERLGLKKRVIQYYEKGDRDGKSVAIPRSVELACLALALGHEAFDGEIAARAIAARSPSASPAADEAPLAAVAALENEPSNEAPSTQAQAFIEPGASSDDASDPSGHDSAHEQHRDGETPAP